MASFPLEKDHRPFGGFGLKLIYGKQADGSYIHIADVPSGLACACICPTCDIELVANKGPQRSHHFAHHDGSGACAGAAETNAHIWAKEILARELKLHIPAVAAHVSGRHADRAAAQIFEFVDARLEHRTGTIVPDVILTARNGRELIVEIFVTHKCDAAKIDKLKSLNTASLEIDLSKLRRQTDEEVVREHLLGEKPLTRAPRHWLHNPVIAQLEIRIEAEIEEERAQKQAAAEQEATALIKAAQTRPSEPDHPLFGSMLREARDLALPGLIGDMPFVASGFSVDTPYWQAALLARLIFPSGHWSHGGLTLEVARIALKDCLLPAFVRPVQSEVREAVRRRQPEFRFPQEAIAAFMGRLLERHVIERTTSFQFQVAAHEKRRIAALIEQERIAIERVKSVRELVAEMLDGLPASEIDGFDFDSWAMTPMGDKGMALRVIAASDAETWTRFEMTLDRIKALWSPWRHARNFATDLLGLPLTGEVERLREKERLEDEGAERARLAALKAAADKRIESLRLHAHELLGERAAQWLETPLLAQGKTPLELSAIGAAEHDNAWSALAEADRDHRRTLALAEHAEICRHKLATETRRVFDETRAKLFLTGYSRELEASPHDYCNDDIRLRHCLALLARQSGQRPKR